MILFYYYIKVNKSCNENYCKKLIKKYNSEMPTGKCAITHKDQ